MSQNTVVNETQENFTIILNKIINYKGKSAKCLGLYVYMASKPNSWKFNDKDISNHFSDGKTALNSAKAELKELGLLSIEPERNEKGHITSWIWRITALIKEPVQNTENPISSETQNLDNTTSSETSTYSKTYFGSKTNNINDNNSIPNNTNKEIKSTKQPKTNKNQTLIEKYENEIPEIIEHWNNEFKMRKISKCSVWLENYCLWREPKKITENITEEGFTAEEIKKAITNIWLDSYWSNIMTPEILFRHFNNKNGSREKVNYIQQMIDKSQEEDLYSASFVKPDIKANKQESNTKLANNSKSETQELEVEFTEEEQIFADQLMSLSTEDFIKARIASKK